MSKRLREHGFGLLLLVSITSSGLSMWAAEWGPFGDVGSHVEVMDVFARGGDATTVYPTTYRRASFIAPNTLSGHFAALLHPLLDASQCARLLLSVYAVALPLSLLAMCFAFRRNQWPSLAAIPLTFNALLSMGAINYLLGLPLMFAAIAVARRWVDRPGPRHGVALSLLVVASYYAHLFAGVMACAFSFVLLVIHARRPHDLLRLLAPSGGALLLTIWGTSMAERMAAGDGAMGAVYDAFPERVADLHEWGLQFFREDPTDELVAVGLSLLFVLGFLARAGGKRITADAGVLALLRRHDFRILTAIAALAWLVLPSHLSQVHVIHQRMIIVMYSFLLLWPPVTTGLLSPMRQRLQWVLVACLAAIGLAYPLHAAERFETFENEVLGDLPAAIAALPQASTLGYMSTFRGNHITYENAPWHIPAGIHAVANGGLNNDSFAMRPYAAIQYVDGIRRPPRPGRGFWAGVARLDYVLWHSPRPAPSEMQGRLELLFHQGAWWLYEVRGPRSPSSTRMVL